MGWFDQHEDFPDWLLAGRTMEMGINIGPYLYPEFDQMKQHMFHQKSDNCQFPFKFVFRNQWLLQDSCNTVKNDFSIHSYWTLSPATSDFAILHHILPEVSKFHHNVGHIRAIYIYIYILLSHPLPEEKSRMSSPPWAPALFSAARLPRVRIGRVLAVPHPDAAERGARGVQWEGCELPHEGTARWLMIIVDDKWWLLNQFPYRVVWCYMNTIWILCYYVTYYSIQFGVWIIQSWCEYTCQLHWKLYYPISVADSRRMSWESVCIKWGVRRVLNTAHIAVENGDLMELNYRIIKGYIMWISPTWNSPGWWF